MLSESKHVLIGRLPDVPNLAVIYQNINETAKLYESLTFLYVSNLIERLVLKTS